MQPICSKETEEAFLGALLIDPSAATRVELAPDDLYFHNHVIVYQAIQDTVNKYGKADILLVSELLEKRGQLTEVGQPWLYGLVNAAPSALHIDAYAAEIRELAERRELVIVGGEMATAAYAGPVDVPSFTKKIADSVRVTGSGTRPVTSGPFTEYLIERKEVYDECKARGEKPPITWGIPSPWYDFNKATGGIHKRRSALFIGLPGVGKSMAAMQIGLVAAELGYKVDIYSMEMTEQDLLGRWVSARTGIPEEKVHLGNLEDGEIERIGETLREIERLPIRISEETHWTSAGINADLVKKGGSDLVIVDYLAKLKDPGEKRFLAEAWASAILKDGAKNLGHALLLVASMVKDGSIKGSAEVGFVQDETWRIEAGSEEGDIKMIPSKRRFGAKAYVNLVMRKGIPLLEGVGRPSEQWEERSDLR